MNNNFSIDKEAIDRKLDQSLTKVVKGVKTKKAAYKVSKIFKLLKGLSTETKVLVCSTLGECVSEADDIETGSSDESLASETVDGESAGTEDVQFSQFRGCLSEACLHAYNHYKFNPSELDRVLTERKEVVDQRQIGADHWDAATEGVDVDLKDLAQQYLKLNINQSKLGQCLQNYFCARIGKKINAKLNSVTDGKMKRAMEKSLRAQLNDATGQSKFFKYCMNAYKMKITVKREVLLLVEVVPPDVYRKISDKKFEHLIDLMKDLLS